MQERAHNCSAGIGTQTFKIITQYGDMLVVRQGIQPSQRDGQQAEQAQQQPQHHHQSQQTRPVIMTFHDLGLNSELQFARFCDCDEVKLMLQTFTMIHVNFVGQEFSVRSQQQVAGATGSQSVGNSRGSLNNLSGGKGSFCESLPSDFKYPNVDQMAESIVDVCTQLRVRSFIALAVGAGAYVAAALALMRPDLVDGLFLINPIVSSCSITEWLYFKMSAIASNYHIRAESHAGESHHQAPAGSTSGEGKAHGFRRLLNAAHIHLPRRTGEGEHPAGEQLPEGEQEAPGEPLSAGKAAGGQSSRLRRLILSRNFKLGAGERRHKQQQQQPAAAGSGDEDSASTSGRHSSRRGSSSSSSTMNSARSLAGEPERKERGDSSDSIEGQPARAKRPPLEYLMYHHFGPSSFQRYRRSSDTPLLVKSSVGGGPSIKLCELLQGSPATCAVAEERRKESAASREGVPGGGDSSAGSSAASSNQNSPRASWIARRRQLGAGQRATSRSNDSLALAAGSQAAATVGAGISPNEARQRSDSVNLSASHLASFGSERARNAYLQAAYKHYFCQLNPNNLWLLAQSFAKRKTLNLRKDCGAAAHAAAAAAALGTSICTAFVGPAPAAPAEASLDPERSNTQPAASQEPTARPAAAARGDSAGQPEARDSKQSALVAGTKVKRTFACQTLIMCSNVQMHRERAFKLMSLLNPLQATCIKTEHLLVLDERPEKVCQALRLFLQGIGYSMSTYERRLRLSSATGSASSADSNGSSRSLAG